MRIFLPVIAAGAALALTATPVLAQATSQTHNSSRSNTYPPYIAGAKISLPPNGKLTPYQAEDHNSSRSNGEPQDHEGIIAPPLARGGVTVSLVGANGQSINKQFDAHGKALFPGLTPGDYGLDMSPANSPAGNVAGALLTNGVLSCDLDQVHPGNVRHCGITVQGSGPTTLTVQLLQERHGRGISTGAVKPAGR